MVRSELRLKELFNPTKFTKNRFLGLRRKHDKSNKPEHGNAAKPVLPPLEDVLLATGVCLNHTPLGWFGGHFVGGFLVLLLLPKLLFKTVCLAIAFGKHAAAGVANRIAWQRYAAAIGACTHGLRPGWRRITVVPNNPF